MNTTEQETHDAKHDKAVAMVRQYVKDLSELERLHLFRWAQELLAIRASNLSVTRKALAALRASGRAEVARSLAALLALHARELGISAKRLAWDQRGWPARLGIAGASIGLLIFRGKRAGIAALGTAIGVPLWLVSGAGGAVLGAIVDECRPKSPTTEYAVIEAEKVDALGKPS